MGNLELMKQRISRMLAITVYDNSKGMIEDYVGFNSPDYMFFRDLMLTPEMITEAAWRLRKYETQLTGMDLWGDDLANAKKPEVKAVKDRRTFESNAKQVGSNVEFTFKGAINKTVALLKSIGARGSQTQGKTVDGKWIAPQWVWTANVNRVLDAKAEIEMLGFDLSHLTRVAEVAGAASVSRRPQFVISRHENNIVIHSPYNEALIAFFRAAGGFSYNNLDHSRKIEINLEASAKLLALVEVARAQDFEIIGAGLLDAVQRDAQTAEAHKAALESLKMNFEVTFPGAELLNIKPYGYQAAGIAFLNAANGRAIIGDEMGLGKTLQALAWVVTNNKRALVICPKSFVFGWASEIQKFAKDSSSQVLNSKPCEFTQSQFTVVNYESVGKHDFSKLQYDTVILDESHLVKNEKTARYKNIMLVAKDVKHVILLSGTAIVNRPVEFFTQLNLVKPGVTGSYGKYTARYCDGHRHAYGWDASGASNLDELRSLIAPIYLRRNKTDVLPELPAKIRQEIRLQGVKINEKRGSDNPLAQITRMKIALAMAKIDSTIEFVKGIVEQGEKVIVFSDYVEPVEKIAAAFGEQAICYLAELNPEQRHAAQEAFQNDPTKMVFVATSKIASVALTLTAASHVVYNDLPWTPGTLLQSEDRAHRIGQKCTVNIYRMVASGSLDIYITELLTSKAEILKAVLEGGVDSVGVDADEKSILTDIVKNFFKKGTDDNENE